MEQMSTEATGFVPQTVVHAPELTACDCGTHVVRHDLDRPPVLPGNGVEQAAP